MSWAMSNCGIAWRIHDPGVRLTHLAVAIANGADGLADMAVLRNQRELFDPVASAATARSRGLRLVVLDAFVAPSQFQFRSSHAANACGYSSGG
jgi:hypothetical protein